LTTIKAETGQLEIPETIQMDSFLRTYDKRLFLPLAVALLNEIDKKQDQEKNDDQAKSGEPESL